jgi:hypothetical protein
LEGCLLVELSQAGLELLSGLGVGVAGLAVPFFFCGLVQGVEGEAELEELAVECLQELS